MPTGIYIHKTPSKETREKLSEAMKKAWQSMDWSERNKKVGIKIQERNIKLGIIPPSRKGISQNQEEKNGMWKGNKVSYGVLHKYIARHLGKPDICEHCGKNNLKGKQIHWANKNGQYKRNLEDWLRLCMSCHLKYDYKMGFR